MNQMLDPILSIVTVCFNDAQNLKRTSSSLNSLKAFLNEGSIEHIIWDGNSTDSTEEIAKTCFPDSIFKKGSDKGIYDAMNKATSFASGKYLFYLNAGDEIILTDPNELNNFLSTLKSGDEDVYIFNTIYSEFSADKASIVPSFISIANNNLKLLCFGMLFSHQGCAIKRSTFKNFHGYSTDYGIVGDWHLFNRLYLEQKSFVKLDLSFVQTYPFGVSSDLISRTLERLEAVKNVYKNSHKLKAIVAMYNLFIAVANNQFNALPPIRIAEQIIHFAPHFDNFTIEAIEKALKVYLWRIHNHHPLKNLWHLPRNFLEVNNVEELMQQRIVFLLSMPRSGSTLLQRLLENSENITSTGEPWICLPILSMLDEKLVDNKCGQELISLAHSHFAKELNLPLDFHKDGVKNYLLTIYHKIFARINTNYYLDKTPRYIHIIDELKSYFPHAKFLILTRHPLEIINSYATTWAGSDFKKVFENKYFMYDFENGFANLINFAKKYRKDSNVCVVDYSQIQNKDPRSLLSISKFLNIPHLTFNLNNSQIAKDRKFGDSKNINNSTEVIATNSKSSVDLAKTLKNQDYLAKILNAIPAFVFDYFSIEKQSLVCSNFQQKNKKTLSKPNKFRHKTSNILVNHVPRNTVGIAVTTFNNSNSIVQVLESIANQLQIPDEIVVSDDCSTDDTVEQVKQFMTLNPHLPIKIISNDANVGISINRDNAIRSLDTTLITHLDGDDLISPLKIKYESKVFQNEKVNVSFSDIKLVFKNSFSLLNTRYYHHRDSRSIITALISRSCPVPRDLMMRKDLFLKSGGFTHQINLYEDWHHKMRLAYESNHKTWAHSGCVGTHYNRKNPGLSNKNPVMLLMGQLKVLTLNLDILSELVEQGLPFSLSHLTALDHKNEIPHLSSLLQITDKSLVDTLLPFCNKLKEDWPLISTQEFGPQETINYLNLTAASFL